MVVAGIRCVPAAEASCSGAWGVGCGMMDDGGQLSSGMSPRLLLQKVMLS